MGKRTGTRTGPNHKFIKRPCKNCEESFIPTSTHNWVCPICLRKNIDLIKVKMNKKIKIRGKNNANK